MLNQIYWDCSKIVNSKATSGCYIRNKNKEVINDSYQSFITKHLDMNKTVLGKRKVFIEKEIMSFELIYYQSLD